MRWFLIMVLVVGVAVAGETSVRTTVLSDGAGTSITVTELPQDGSGARQVAYSGTVEGFGHIEGIITLAAGQRWRGEGPEHETKSDGDGSGVLPKKVKLKINVDPDDDQDGDTTDDQGGEVEMRGGTQPGVGARPLYS